MRRVSPLLLCLLALPTAASAQQSTAPSIEDRALIQQLLKRVGELEAQVKELQAERMKSGIPAPAPAQPPAEVVPPQPPPESALHTGTSPLQLRGFSDIDFHTGNQSKSSFKLGQLDLFITSRLSDKVNVINENVVEADEHNAFGIEVERLLLQYAVNPYLNVAVGRYHTAIGYYNTAYHHGTWLQTATGRPFLFLFEDQGGILPIHNVGISATGSIPSGRLGLRYAFEIGNGRTSRSPLDEPVQNVVDENNGKAINVALIARPDGVPGLQTGFSLYHDKLEPEGLPKIKQTISAAHVVYVTPSFEWLNEGLLIHHTPQGTGKTFNTLGFYAQIGRQFGKARPYFRYQYLNAPRDEPIFGDVGLRRGPSLGLRYDLDESTAFKVQYDHASRRGQSAINELTLQSAFTF